MRRTGKRALHGAAAVGAGLMVLFADQSLAASRVCRQLEAELVSGGRGGGSQVRKYDRAIAAQREQLSTANSQARRAGCGFGFLSPRRCTPLNSQIDRMEANLASLERKRAGLGSGAPQRSRAAIVAALNANGCRNQELAARKPPLRAPDDEIDADLFARLFGGEIEEQDPLDQQQGPTNVTRILNPNGEVDVLGPAGEFSTMCVRTCDGYFFPVSPNSSSFDFERDQKNCEATCPGTDVQLYYRPVGTDITETMLSTATGEPYQSLPTAYVYRDLTKPRVQACGCKGVAVDPNFAIIGGETAEEEVPTEPVIPTPTARPDPALDPETLANLEGGLDLETIRRILKPKPVAAPILPPGERKVRVVGPMFLPDLEGAIDLQAPGRKEGR